MMILMMIIMFNPSDSDYKPDQSQPQHISLNSQYGLKHHQSAIFIFMKFATRQFVLAEYALLSFQMSYSFSLL